MGRGLYIHIPFCYKRCSYCDFTTYAGKEDLMGSYTDALIGELEKKTEDKTYDTIFIGGGTPNYLDIKELEKLLKFIRDNIKKTEGYEFTMEGNPEFMTLKKAQIMKKYGVNRVSMGLQSSSDETLRIIGRIHTFEKFLSAYENLKCAGFLNINIDLMTGLPGTSADDMEDKMRFIEKLSPSHVSVYSLILEEGTEMEKAVSRGILKLPSEDETLKMMDKAEELLLKWGYEKYEISNFSKKGYSCRHNINYWKAGEYTAAGVAASGFEGNIRYKNTDSITGYIELIGKGEDPKAESYENTIEDSMEEFMFLGLRMTEGIRTDDFEKRFNVSYDEIYGKTTEKFVNEGFLEKQDGIIRFTPEGLRVSNSILCEFILT